METRLRKGSRSRTRKQQIGSRQGQENQPDRRRADGMALSPQTLGLGLPWLNPNSPRRYGFSRGTTVRASHASGGLSAARGRDIRKVVWSSGSPPARARHRALSRSRARCSAQPDAVGGPPAGLVRAVETLEQAALLVRWDARPVLVMFRGPPSSPGCQPDADGPPSRLYLAALLLS